MAGTLALVAGFLWASVSGVVLDGASTAKTKLRAGQTLSQDIVIHTPEVSRDMMICNAYAWAKPLDVYRVRGDVKVSSKGPIKYKECRSFDLAFNEGDMLEFKTDSLNVGTFRASKLPSMNMSLLLIPHRRKASSLSLAFSSHAFSEQAAPQIVVIDAYQGKKKNSLKIITSDTKKTAVNRHTEPLQFNSVVGVNPGNYEVMLASDAGSNLTSSLVQLAHKSKCVVMRVGFDTDQGAKPSAKEEFPADLVVFQKSSYSSAWATDLKMLILIASVSFTLHAS